MDLQSQLWNLMSASYPSTFVQDRLSMHPSHWYYMCQQQLPPPPPPPPQLSYLLEPSPLPALTMADANVTYTNELPMTHIDTYQGHLFAPLPPPPPPPSITLGVDVQTNKPVSSTKTHATHTYTVARTKASEASLARALKKPVTYPPLLSIDGDVAHHQASNVYDLTLQQLDTQKLSAQDYNKRAMYLKKSQPMPSFVRDIVRNKSSKYGEACRPKIRTQDKKTLGCPKNSNRPAPCATDIDEKLKENKNFQKIAERFDTALLKYIMNTRRKNSFVTNEKTSDEESDREDSEQRPLVLGPPSSPDEEYQERHRTSQTKWNVSPPKYLDPRLRSDWRACPKNIPRRRLFVRVPQIDREKQQDLRMAKACLKSCMRRQKELEDYEEPRKSPPYNPPRKRARDFF